MSTDATRGADTPDPTNSSSASGNAASDDADRQERAGGLLEPLDMAEQLAGVAPAWDFGAVAEQPEALEAAEAAEPETRVDDQLTDPAFSSPVYPDAPPVNSWAPQASVSPDYVPPATRDGPPYAPPYAFPHAATAPDEESFPRASGYPARYAPVYPLPLVRRARLPLVGILLAIVLAAVVVLALARGVFSASGRATTGPLYSNVMTSSSSDWPNDKECYFKSDGYHIAGASNCYYSGAQYQDARVTVTAKLASDAQKGDAQGAYGIAFRRPSKDNFYIFLINVSGDWFIVKDNSLLQKAEFNSAIKTGVGASNTLSVRMQGSQFTFFANGAQLGALTDDTYTTGAVGLAGDTNLDVAYRNFTVTRP